MGDGGLRNFGEEDGEMGDFSLDPADCELCEGYTKEEKVDGSQSENIRLCPSSQPIATERLPFFSAEEGHAMSTAAFAALSIRSGSRVSLESSKKYLSQALMPRIKGAASMAVVESLSCSLKPHSQTKIRLDHIDSSSVPPPLTRS